MSDLSSSASARSYLDFQGLANLRSDAARNPDKAVRQTAEQFEAYFIQEMMKSMRQTVDKSDLVDGGNMEMYQDLMDKEVSLQMVRRGGVGLADMLEKQMLQQQTMAQASTQDALRNRASAAAEFLPLQPAGAAGMPLSKPGATALPLQRPAALELPQRTGVKP
jgi:Rod binding domain-containing protein